KDVSGLLIICLAFVQHLRQPVLAVILSTELGFVALFNSIYLLPGFYFLSDGGRAKLQGDVGRSQRGNVGMPQVYLQLNGMRLCFVRIESSTTVNSSGRIFGR